MAAEQADGNPAAAQAPPLNDPALADGDTVEEIGDAPVRDAELVAPLPPLEQFEVEPVEFAREESEEEVVEIAYSVQVNGLDAADEQTDTSLRGQFADLSALEDGDGEAANVAQVSARLTEDSALMQRILAAEGCTRHAPRRVLIDRMSRAEQPLTAVIDVLPGPRYVFSDIVIDAPPTEPANLIRDNLALQVGEPIIATRVQGAEAQVAVTLPQNGYPFAEIGQRDILLDQETGDGVYTLPVTTGPRSRFGEIRTTGNLVFDAEHVEVLARFKRGELYDSRMVDDLRQALVATGLFNTVSVLPEQSGEAAGDGTEYASILVEQDAGPPRTLAGSAGFGTGQGFRIEGSWTHRNLFPPEGALIARAVAGTQEQGAGLTFRRSNAGRRDRTFQASAEALHSNYDAYEAFTGRLSALVSYDLDQYLAEALHLCLRCATDRHQRTDYDLAFGELDRRTFFIGGLIGQVGIDRTDSLLDARDSALPRWSNRKARWKTASRPTRARVDGSAYFSPTDAITLAGRVRFGTIQALTGST